MKTKQLLSGFAVFAFCSVLAIASQDVAKEKVVVKSDNAALIAKQKPSYPLTTCPMSGEALGADAVDHIQDGRLVRMCCSKCVEGMQKDPAAMLAKVDAAVIRAQKASYPLDTCVLSGEKLGGADMGEPLDMVHGTRLVRLCCKGCVKGFNKNPEAAIAKIDEALIKAQLATYPLTKCAVSGEDLGDDTVNYLHGTQLVRFCCEGCVKGFNKSPEKVLAQITAASAKGVKEAGDKKRGGY